MGYHAKCRWVLHNSAVQMSLMGEETDKRPGQLHSHLLFASGGARDERMGRMMMGIAVALIVLGLAAYVGTGRVSVTALIPAFFGIALAGLGALGLKDRFRVPSAYGGIVLSVVGLLGSVSGIPKVIAYLGGEEVPRPAASIAQSIMALILLVLVVSLVKFVIAERRQARSP